MFDQDPADMIRPVPQQRIIEKMNEWLEEAKLGKDLRGQLMLRNELVGHYRKTGQKEPAMESAREAIELLSLLDMENSISAGTTYVNIATACNAFGEYDRSMEMFLKARTVYEKSAHTEPQLLGGLYNNMALTCTALAQKEEAKYSAASFEKIQELYQQALELYEKALLIMAEVPDGELEQAITYLNMANTVEALLGMEEGESRINELVEKAEDLMEDKSEELLGKDDALLAAESEDGPTAYFLSRQMRSRLGYYAFVCEKCAPTFSYYGYFLAAEKLKDRSDRLAAIL